MRIRELLAENLTTADIPVVNYDRNYGGDINKVLAVKPNATADAQAIYKKLGGVSNENYEKMSALVQAKIKELRNVYQTANAQKGLKGAAALKSPEYLLFRKQSNDLKIMSSTAMDMMLNAVNPKPAPKQYKSIADYKAQNPDKIPMSIAQYKAQNPTKVGSSLAQYKAQRGMK